jgi:RNA polymerase sigma-70 factor (ECF subfamily)
LAQDNKLIRSLIEGSRNGNINAFEQLFRMHVGYVYAISFRMLANTDDANENTSKIFVEAWKTISMARRESPFILWLKAITIYSSLQRIREREKGKIDSKQKPKRKGLSFIDQELLTLPEPERIVFVLHDIENYKKEEISDLLTITEKEAEILLNKARGIIMDTLVIKSINALERALKQVPETLEPIENLYNRFIDEISKIKSPEKHETSEPEQEKDNKSDDIKTNRDKKRFSFKDLFKKKE